MEESWCMCSSTADADLLGLGVRLGAYLQAAGAIVGLALDSLPRRSTAKLGADDQHRNVSNPAGDAWYQIFIAVPTIVLAVVYLHRRTISTALFLAIAYLWFAQSVVVFPGLFCISCVDQHFNDPLVGWAILAMLLGTGGVLLWFWIDGYTMCCNAQTVYAFIFAKVPAFGWFRYFSIASLSVGSAVVVGLLVRRLCSRVQGQHSCPENRRRRRPALLFMLLVLAFEIAGVEFTLRWNDIGGVSSLHNTGQIIAAIAGGAALFRPIYAFIKPWLNEALNR